MSRTSRAVTCSMMHTPGEKLDSSSPQAIACSVRLLLMRTTSIILQMTRKTFAKSTVPVLWCVPITIVFFQWPTVERPPRVWLSAVIGEARRRRRWTSAQHKCRRMLADGRRDGHGRRALCELGWQGNTEPASCAPRGLRSPELSKGD